MNRLCIYGWSAAAAVALASFTGCASSDEPEMDPEEMMAQWEAMNRPGEHQEHLKSMVGTWDVVNTMWMEPGAEPMVSKGVAVNRMIMDGRYLEGEYEGEWEGEKFTGKGLTGYDNMTGKYINVWADSMSTGLMTSEGECTQDGKVFNFECEMNLGEMGGIQKCREVITIVSPDKYTFEWFEKRGGDEMKTMEIVYTRKR